MFRRKNAVQKLLRHSFVVTKVDGGMFQGALIEEGEWMRFEFVKVPDPDNGGAWVKAPDGGVCIFRDRIDYMQPISIVDVVG